MLKLRLKENAKSNTKFNTKANTSAKLKAMFEGAERGASFAHCFKISKQENKKVIRQWNIREIAILGYKLEQEMMNICKRG